MTPAAWLRLLLHPLAGQHPKNQQIFGDPVGWHVISINYLFVYSFWILKSANLMHSSRNR